MRTLLPLYHSFGAVWRGLFSIVSVVRLTASRSNFFRGWRLVALYGKVASLKIPVNLDMLSTNRRSCEVGPLRRLASAEGIMS